jgi:hypothetical protein
MQLEAACHRWGAQLWRLGSGFAALVRLPTGNALVAKLRASLVEAKAHLGSPQPSGPIGAEENELTEMNSLVEFILLTGTKVQQVLPALHYF